MAINRLIGTKFQSFDVAVGPNSLAMAGASATPGGAARAVSFASASAGGSARATARASSSTGGADTGSLRARMDGLLSNLLDPLTGSGDGTTQTPAPTDPGAPAPADPGGIGTLPDPTDNPFLGELEALLNASVLQSVAVLGKQIEMGIVTAGVTALSGLAGAFRDIVTTVGRNIRA